MVQIPLRDQDALPQLLGTELISLTAQPFSMSRMTQETTLQKLTPLLGHLRGLTDKGNAAHLPRHPALGPVQGQLSPLL